MPNIPAPAFSFPSKSFPAQQAGAPAGAMGELSMSELLGKYATLAKSGKMFYTSAITVAGAIGWATNNAGAQPVTPTVITAVNAYAGGGTSALAVGGVLSTA